MRIIFNISLPESLAKIVETEVKESDYATTSEFFRYLVKNWYARKMQKEEERKQNLKEFLKNWQEKHSIESAHFEPEI